MVGFGWYSGATEMADGEGEEERRTLANLGRNRECQGRNSLRLVFVFAAFYRSRRSYTPAILKRETPISSHSITPISRSSQNFPSIQKDENTPSSPPFPSKIQG